ncbi:MAG: permease-like cell division protein FtsX [Thiomargarita sp.]|nr:permease-like cell division protein FtsX [Thiomargarita sp.]
MKKTNRTRKRRQPKVNFLLLFHIWLSNHISVFFSSFLRIVKTPLPTLMTTVVIGIALALPTGLYLLLDNLDEVTKEWGGLAQISLFLKPEIKDDAQVHALREKLSKRYKNINIRAITPTQALAEYHKLSGFDEAFEILEENPLPGVLIVQPVINEIEINQQLFKQLQQLPEVDIAQFDMLWLKRFFAILNIINRVTFIIAGLFALAVLLIIGNTIRLIIYNQRDEIEIYKLVGATDGFIRRPFLYIGFWYGLLGGFIAWLLVHIAFLLLQSPVKQLTLLYDSEFQLITLDLFSSLILTFFSAILGLTGAWLVVGKYLKDIQAH